VSALRAVAEDYLRVRRALGYKLEVQDRRGRRVGDIAGCG